MKKCASCKEEKGFNDFPKCLGRNKKTYRRGKCKACTSDENLQRISNDSAQSEKKRIRNKKWRHNNPTRVESYRTNQKDNMKKYSDSRREALSDGYIIGVLGLKVSDKGIEDIVEAKRYQIKIQRLLKERGYERSRFAGQFS